MKPPETNKPPQGRSPTCSATPTPHDCNHGEAEKDRPRILALSTPQEEPEAFKSLTRLQLIQRIQGLTREAAGYRRSKRFWKQYAKQLEDNRAGRDGTLA